MSILTNVAIPVLTQSSQHINNRIRSERILAGRSYGDEPLPIKPSSHAPRQAHIVSRVAEHGVALYLLQIGEIFIPDVGLEEILDYVSPRELEEFETRQFEEENRVLKIAEAVRQAELEEARERANERARQKGTAVYQESDDQSSTDGEEIADAALGRHGRARPSYAHLYKAPKQRHRRRRDPFTGELIPLSDEDAADATDGGSSQDERSGTSALPSRPVSGSEAPRRRRRKRDKITGELLPLSPEFPAESRTATSTAEAPILSGEASKRPRRRRHPITRELMPLGWRYNPDAEREVKSLGSGADASAVPLDQNDNTRYGPDIKRLKLTSDNADSSSAESAFVTERHQDDREALRSNRDLRARTQSPPSVPSGDADTDPSDPDTPNPDRSNALLQKFIAKPPTGTSSAQGQTASSVSKPRANVPMKQVTLASFLAASRGADRSSPASSTSSESMTELHTMPNTQAAHALSSRLTSQNTVSHKKTDIPFWKPRLTKAQKAGIIDASPPKTRSETKANEESEHEEEGIQEDEWFVEAILTHGLSDPRTHPPEFGDKSVMLYHTKWQGFETPTWEPAESFIDSEILDTYRRKAGLGSRDLVRESGRSLQKSNPFPASASKNSLTKLSQAQANHNVPMGSQIDYEVEEILNHRLSDPKRHPKELKRDPVMLYHVKWVGHAVPTWEPIDSFTDRSIVEEYKARARARNVTRR